MQKAKSLFDIQAPTFDERAGLSENVAQRVAQAVLQLGNIENGDTVLEIGAGTGELGRWLSESSYHYIGLDNSTAMLDEFRTRIGNRPTAKIEYADANESWPVESESIRLIFGSRVFHLLDIEHVLKESERVRHPEGMTLVMGKVKRKRDSVKTLMRDKMRELLVKENLVPRAADKQRARLIDDAVAMGAERLEWVEAATWEVHPRPMDSIRSWMGKESMGGIVPSVETKEKILEELSKWAKETFGDPEKEVVTQETYLLEGARFSSRRR